MAKIKKETLIMKERERLERVFFHVEPNQLQTVDGLIDRAAFMRITLEELEKEINTSGAVEMYQHGKEQSGLKASAAIQAYNGTVKNYATVIKQLVSLLPEPEQNEAKQTTSLLELLKKSKEET